MARMSKERRDAAIAAMKARSIAEAIKKSTAERFAVSQKGVEALVRDFYYDGGLRSELDFRARTAGKADIIIRGRRGEIKSGGEVAKNMDESWTEDDILADAVWVVFPIMTEIADEYDVPDNTVVMTRETFIKIAATCSRKGIRGTFHVTTRGTLAFQSTPLRVLRETFTEMICSGKLPTLRSFKEEEEE